MRGDYGNGKFNNYCKNVVCEIDSAVNNNESWTSATGRIYNGTELIKYQDELYELGGIVHLYFKVVMGVGYPKTLRFGFWELHVIMGCMQLEQGFSSLFVQILTVQGVLE